MRSPEPQPGVDVSPFRFEGDRRGVLLVHGFSGTPFEVRPLGESLAARGFTVAGPVLAGHESRRALADSTWRDWYRSVEQAFDELRARCEVIGVCGQSLGGLLTLELARRRREQVAAIATLAGALFLAPWTMALARRIRRAPLGAPLLRRAAIPKLLGSDIADPEMRRRNPSHPMPLRAVVSLVECMDHVGAELARGEVDRPALVAHARHDHTIPFACADAIAAALRGPVERVTLERSFHVVSLDVERELLFARVGDFFERRFAAR